MSSDRPHRRGGIIAVDRSFSSLEERRKLGQLAMQRTRTPMVMTDPRRADNPIVLVNEALLVLTGYDAEDVIGLSHDNIRAVGLVAFKVHTDEIGEQPAVRIPDRLAAQLSRRSLA